MASVNQTRPHCVNQMGKTHSKRLAAWHGMAGERHGHGMLCVNWPLNLAATGTGKKLIAQTCIVSAYRRCGVQYCLPVTVRVWLQQVPSTVSNHRQETRECSVQMHVQDAVQYKLFKSATGQQQLVEALGYKPRGRECDSRLGNWDYSLTEPAEIWILPAVEIESADF